MWTDKTAQFSLCHSIYAGFAHAGASCGSAFTGVSSGFDGLRRVLFFMCCGVNPCLNVKEYPSVSVS